MAKMCRCRPAYFRGGGLITRKQYADSSRDDYTYGRGRNLRKVFRTQGTNTQEVEWKYENWQAPSASVIDSAWRVKGEYLGTDEEQSQNAAYTYRRDGSLATVKDLSSTNGAFVTRTFNYDAGLGRVSSISLPSMFDITEDGESYGQSRVKYLYDGTATGETPGRPSGVQLGIASDSDLHYSQSRGYRSDNGLLFSAAFANQRTNVRSIEYTYRANTALVQSSSLLEGITERFRRDTVWETNRNRVKTIDNQRSGVHAGFFEYNYDERSRMSWEVRTGTVPAQFDTSSYGNRETYAYADGRQLSGTELFKLLGTWNPSTPPAQTELTGSERAYTHDAAANRKTSKDGTASTVSYTRNSLNQYTQVGSATVENKLGNLYKDGSYTYTYTDKNELKEVAATSPVTGSYRINNTYDYLGRRVRKLVRKWSGGGWTVTESDTRFIYDGWKLIAELDGLNTNSVKRTYVWAQPEAGGLNAGGGQGALVAIQDHGVTYAPVYDGRGNVTGLLNTATGTLVAAYRYDAYGNVTASGSYASTNPIGYKSQYTDREVGLIYYSHRFYHPRHGRFIQRDPIGEAGGLNLYGFAGNDPVNGGDALGLATLTREWYEERWYPSPMLGARFSNTVVGSAIRNEAFTYFDPNAWGVSMTFRNWDTYGIGATLRVTRRSSTETFRAFGSPEDNQGWVEGTPRPGDDLGRMVLAANKKTDPTAGNKEVVAGTVERGENSDVIGETVERYLEMLEDEANDGNAIAAEALKLLRKDGVSISIEEHVYSRGKLVNGLTDSNAIGGEFSSANIQIKGGMSVDEALATLVHEAAHILDSTKSELLQKRYLTETDAHTFEETYRISKNMDPAVPGFQKGKGKKKGVNEEAIEKWARKNFPEEQP